MNKKICKFPESIDFENAAEYALFFQRELQSNLIFDLSRTRVVHSSFIGFLINMKENLEKNGGLLSLSISKPLEILFNQFKIYEYFSPILTTVSQKKTA